MIKRAQNQAGSVAFFVAAIVIPTIFFVFTLSVDLSRYYHENQRSQAVLDEAAMYAYRFLPYREAASDAALAYLSYHQEIGPHTEVLVTQDTISLALSRITPLTFARLFGIEAGIPITAFSRVRGTPFDTLILMDRGSYLSPDPVYGTIWGEAGDWPAAYFFEHEHPIVLGAQTLDPKLLTQQCFNPAFSALKHSAIKLYENLVSFNLNAVALGFFPGNAAPVDMVRELRPGRYRAGQEGEADFFGHRGVFSGPELCAAAAEREPVQSHYSFPSSNIALEGAEGFFPGGPINMIQPGSWAFDPDYQSFLRAREVIWSRSTHEAATSYTSQIFETIGSNLIGAPQVAERGGLMNKSVKNAVIYAGDLPRAGLLRFPAGAVQSQLSEAISALKSDLLQFNETLKIYYVLLAQPEVTNGDLALEASALRDFFKQQELINGVKDERFGIELLFSSSPSGITADLVSALILDKKTTVVAR